MIISTIPSLPGSGKTEVAIQHIKKNIAHMTAITYVAPTMKLLASIKERLIEQGISPSDIAILDSSTTTKVQNVSDKILDERANRTKKLHLITSASLANLANHTFTDDLMIVDEELNALSTSHYNLVEQSSKMIFSKYVNAKTCSVDDLYKLELVNISNLDRTDTVYEKTFKDLITTLETSNLDVYVIKKQFDDYLSGERTNFTTFEVLSPRIFENVGELIYLGYDIQNTVSSLIYKSPLYDVTFTKSALTKDLRFHEYTSNIIINYFLGDEKGNRSVGNGQIESNPDVPKKVTAWINENVNDYLVIGWNYKPSKKAISIPKFNSDLVLPKVSHGLNEQVWMEKTSVVVMSNFRMSIEDTFLKTLGYKNREGDTGRHINLVIQAIARCAVRNNPPCDINIYVLDQFTATRIQAQIGGCINEIDLKIGQTRKEPKHKMSVEDKKARERDRAKYNRLKRKGSLTPAQKMEFTRLSMLFAKGVKV